MFAAESERQVLLFVHQVLQFVPNVAGIIYDFACGVKLHINKQVRLRAGQPEERAWGALAQLRWIVDKLHFRGHKGCKNPDSAWYQPDTNPYVSQLQEQFLTFLWHKGFVWHKGETVMKPSNSLSVSSDMFRSQAHDDLRGIDTEAAERFSTLLPDGKLPCLQRIQCIRNCSFWSLATNTTRGKVIPALSSGSDTLPNNCRHAHPQQGPALHMVPSSTLSVAKERSHRPKRNDSCHLLALGAKVPQQRPQAHLQQAIQTWFPPHLCLLGLKLWLETSWGPKARF